MSRPRHPMHGPALRSPALPRLAQWLAAAIASFCPVLALAGLAEGLEALKRGDYTSAARELRPAAEQGDAEAQYRIGLMYEFGRGFPLDKAAGIAWFRKAAARGSSAAEQELGVIYANGDGVAQDAGAAAAWFRKAADHGNLTAQYNLGLLYAKGSGVKLDNAQAIAWWRKAAEQGELGSQFKLGVAYENGEGVPKDAVLAYANYAIAARSGNVEYVRYRDDIAAQLDAAQLREARVLAERWRPGTAMPARLAAASDMAGRAATGAPVADKCSATGTMEGAKFAAMHCAVALYGDQHSVAIWFNEDPIAPSEAEAFGTSSYADDNQGGKPRTLARIMFCPGGGAATASPAAVRSIDLATNHARSPLPGIQWVVEAPKDFNVERMSGEVSP